MISIQEQDNENLLTADMDKTDVDKTNKRPTILQQLTFMSVMWGFFFVLCMSIAITNLIISLYKWDVHQWFRDGVTNDILLKPNSSDADLDKYLHLLSRWEGLNASQWVTFAQHAYIPLLVNNSKNMHFLEIGIGVGAWTRVFLKDNPNLSGWGIDIEHVALDVARYTLKQWNVKLMKLDMVDVPYTFHDYNFDYVFFPGSLCYADNLSDVYWLIRGLWVHNVVRVGGKISITFLSTVDNIPCVTKISKEYWNNLRDKFHIISMEDLNTFGYTNMYSIFLERYK